MKFIDTPIGSQYFAQDDRIEIADCVDSGESVKSIALRIHKSYQSVCREIVRNRKPNGSYQPWYAHAQAYQARRRTGPHGFETDPKLCGVVTTKLAILWSTQQVSRWLRRRWPKRISWHVCAETIYEAVYRGLINVGDHSALRTGRTYRHKWGRGRSRDGALKQSTLMRSIHDRPVPVENRRQSGHWEGDLIIGPTHRSAIGTLIERKSRYTLLVPVREGCTAQIVGDAVIAALNSLPPHLRRTLTWDQGNEMFHHERVEQETGTKMYFADPHSPWQRGTNENTNGLLRQY